MNLDQLFDNLEWSLYGDSKQERYSAFRELKKTVYAMRHIDPVLGCVITEPPAARGGQGEKYHAVEEGEYGKF